MESAHKLAKTIAQKPTNTIRAAKESANGIALVEFRNSYRYDQGFPYELSLIGEGEKARQAFLDGRR